MDLSCAGLQSLGALVARVLAHEFSVEELLRGQLRIVLRVNIMRVVLVVRPAVLRDYVYVEDFVRGGRLQCVQSCGPPILLVFLREVN